MNTRNVNDEFPYMPSTPYIIVSTTITIVFFIIYIFILAPYLNKIDEEEKRRIDELHQQSRNKEKLRPTIDSSNKPKIRRTKEREIQTEILSTDYGDAQITINGDKKSYKYAFICYPDWGLNSKISYDNFANYLMSEYDFNNVLIVYIDINFNNMKKYDYDVRITDLSKQLYYIVNHYQIQSFIGFGIGLGSSVLMEFTMDYSNKVLGLILSNFKPFQKSRMELANYLLFKLKSYFYRLFDVVYYKHFSSSYISYDSSLLSKLRDKYQFEYRNVLNFYWAYLERDLFITSDFPSYIPILFFSGSINYDNQPHDTLKVLMSLDRNISTSIEISHSSHQVFEERPEMCESPVVCFLQNIGLHLE